MDVVTEDLHTAGEPFRIVVEGGPELPGATVAERRARAIDDPAARRARRLLCLEPRGHADMYGAFLVPPDDDGADLGVLFWHKDGFSTACGHGTIALGAWAVASGRVPAPADGEVTVVVDVPSGRVRARVRCVGGRVASVTFRNVPAFVLARRVEVPTSAGPLSVDLAYGGAIYAVLRASDVGLAVTPEHHDALLAIGREVKHAVDALGAARHPSDPRLSGTYATMLVDDLGDGPEGPRQRNVTVFADGQVDRSPCGSGTSARCALLHADGRLGPGRGVLEHGSIVGTTFRAAVVEEVRADGHDAVLTEVEGMAHRTGSHRFVLDADDPLPDGFVLR